MKYWRGYIVAALCAALTWALTSFAAAHGTLVDMIYPYATRLILTALAEWTASVDFCLWQLVAALLGVALLASVVAMVVLRWNFVQWAGWVLAVCSGLYMLHTGLFGLNYYSSSLSEDIRLEEADYTVSELANAAEYFLEQANALSTQVPRNADGSPDYPEFAELAEMAADGFDNLVYDQYLSVFAGSTIPVKELGWADLYTSMGITGFTMPMTGEAAVNPQTPAVALPFTMCHEMCHRMCIAGEDDANLGAFLACISNSDPIYQYSGYFYAFRYCYNALLSVGTNAATAAARELYNGMNDSLAQDIAYYRDFFNANQDKTASNVANTVNDTYLKSSGDSNGVISYAKVSDHLVSWYIQKIYLPEHQEEEEHWDPTDRNQVDLTENAG